MRKSWFNITTSVSTLLPKATHFTLGIVAGLSAVFAIYQNRPLLVGFWLALSLAVLGGQRVQQRPRQRWVGVAALGSIVVALLLLGLDLRADFLTHPGR